MWQNSIAKQGATIPSKGLWLLLGVALLLGRVESAVAQNDISVGSVPQNSIRSRFIERWLILGPIPREDAIEVPTELLGDIREGKQVTFQSGVTRQWTPLRADPGNGRLGLNSFCQNVPRTEAELVQLQGTSLDEHVVVYAVCELVDAACKQRQLMAGADDGLRMWVDGELLVDDVKPGFYVSREHLNILDFSVGTALAPGKTAGLEGGCAKRLFLELHNWTGAFRYSVFTGSTAVGSVRCPDGSTPVSGTLVRFSADGQAIGAVRTDKQGNYTFSPVPNDTPISIRVGDSIAIAEPSIESVNGAGVLVRRQDIIADRPQYPDWITIGSKHKSLGGAFSSMLELPDGRLLLASTGERKIYTYDGLEFSLHADARLGDLTSAHVRSMELADDGALWLVNEANSVFRLPGFVASADPFSDSNSSSIAPNDSIQHWTAGSLGGGILDMKVHPNGSAWFAVNSGGSQAEKMPTVVRCIPGDPKPQAIHEVTNIRHLAVAGGRTFMLSGTSGRILEVQSEGSIREHLVPFPVSKVEDVAVDSKTESLLIATSACLIRRTVSGQWQRWNWIEDFGRFASDITLAVSPTGDVWCSIQGASVILQLVDDSLVVRSRSPIRAEAIVASRTGALFAAPEYAGLVELRPQRMCSFDARDGIADNVLQLNRKGGEVVAMLRWPDRISLHERITRLRADKQATASVSYGPVVRALPGGASVKFPSGLGPIVSRGTAYKPKYVNPDGQEHELENPTNSKTGFSSYNFCEVLRDGRILVGCLGGLLEIRDQQFCVSDIVPPKYWAKQHGARALVERESGELWIGRSRYRGGGGGSVLRVREGLEKEVAEIRLNASVTSLAEVDGAVYVATTEGLLLLDDSQPDLPTVERVDHPVLRSAAVITMQRTLGGSLWVATSKDGVYVLHDGEIVPQFAGLMSPGDMPQLRSLEIADDGSIWCASSDQVFAYRPSNVAPTLIIGEVRLGVDDSFPYGTRSFDAACGRIVSVRLTARDDSGHFQYRHRIDGGDWVSSEHGVVSHHLQFSLPESGAHTIEMLCVDADLNASAIQELSVSSFVPFWERAVVQVLGTGLLALVSLGLIVVGIVYIRTKNALIDKGSQAREAAEDAANERELLLARVCHDLRSPTTVVAVCSELVTEGGAVMPLEEMAELLKSSASSMTYMTDQLLSYARSLRKRDDRPETPAKMARLFRRLEDSVALRFSEAEVQFRAEVSPDAPPTLAVAEELLLELVTNLVDNSFRHTESGEVVVRYGLDQTAELLLQVFDTGCGMTDVAAAHAFEPFKKGHKGASNCGLGLSIVKHLVDRLQGYIEVESAPGEGTIVSITLPASLGMEFTESANQGPDEVHRDEQGEWATAVGPADSGVHGASRVMVFDDDLSTRRALGVFLEGRGYTVFVADERIAREAIIRFRPDTIVADLSMPTRSGFELARYIREEIPQLRELAVIAMTGDDVLLGRAEEDHIFDSAFSKHDAVARDLLFPDLRAGRV